MVTVLETTARRVRASKAIVEDYIDSSLRRLSEAGSVIEKDQEATEAISLEVDFIQTDIEIRLLGKEAYVPTVQMMKQTRRSLIRTIERKNMK